ncbi:helix-turn-helix domain-containing protein [Enterococcus sp. BWM-S5]|uniref:Helix-turn-helix domain-containing protein n=1 Tax=Enterococcus larvae TaxID=2794352 RepID=A0ABS4CIE2_9ENTE|nr:helix-turn-helix domain-containing protein [Enterococcus larvae]MBP1046367.1 helix-turn-helix domain-containing protein [Enterococcus larvae]
MLETIILDDFSQKKLDMFHQFLECDDGTYSPRYFKQFTDFSHARLVSLFTEMDDDLQQQIGTPLLTDDGKITINKEQLITASYQQYLFQESIAYKFLLASILEKNYRLEDFCEENYISRASVLRKLQPIISYLKKFDIQINCSKMRITGNEAIIRIVYFNFFWLTSFGEDFFLALGENKRGPELFDFNDKQWMKYVEPRQWFLLTSINRLRLEKAHFLAETPFDQLVYPETNLSFFDELKQLGISKQFRSRESDFLSYMLFYWIPYFHSDDPRIPYVKSYMLSDNHPLGNLIGEFQNFYISALGENALTEDEKELLHINIFTTFLNHAIREDRLPLAVDFSYDLFRGHHPLFEPLFHDVQAFLKKTAQTDQHRWILNCLDHLVFSCTVFLLPFFEREKQNHQLRVGVILFQNAIVSQSLFEYLAKIPFVEAELITSFEKKDYDYYIATSALLLPKSVRRKGNFKLITLTEIEKYQTILFSTLQERYSKKADNFIAG